jgi:peptide/nickel transport system substrate-binding protein
MQGRHIQLANYPVLLENQEKGHYRVLNWPLQGASWYVSPNLTLADTVLAELFNTPDFRKALSLGIDRASINELVWLGLGVPRQPVPAPWDPYYPGDEAGNYCLEYDPDEANRLLDALGLTAKDADGIRLRSDGKPIRFKLTGMAGFLGNDTLELVKADWQKIGILIDPEIVERALLFEMAYANQLECLYFTSDAYPFTGNPQTNVSNASNPICWGRLWQTWYNSGGQEGMEPPDWIKHLTDLHNEARSAGREKQIELAQEIYDIWGKALVQIGLIGMTPNPHVVNADLRNVPESSGNDFPLRSPGNTRPELYYYQK